MSVASPEITPENRNYKFNTYVGVIDFDINGIIESFLPVRKGWSVQVTDFAKNTHNPIRAIVEGLKIEPNPEKQLIALSIGDPTTFGNLRPAPEIIEAVKEVVENEQHNGYGPSNGFLPARQAIVEYIKDVQGEVTPNDIIIGSGCSCSLDLCISVLAGPGQNILIPRPGFSIYRTLAEGFNVECRSYNLIPEKNWEIDLGHLESLIDAKTAAIVITNPSNPCGSVFSKEHILEILAVAEKNFVPIIADEIYEHFVFPGKDYYAMSALSKNVPILSCGGLTKRFLVPGWRFGWVVIHDRHDAFKDVRKGLANLSSRILGANTMVQGALPKILKTTPQSFYDNIIETIHKHAIIAYDLIKKNCKGLHPIMPEGAMYMMIRIDIDHYPEYDNELELLQDMIKEQSVFCLPGKCFDIPNYMRIVLTVPEEMMIEACHRMAEFCENHYKTDNREIIQKEFLETN